MITREAARALDIINGIELCKRPGEEMWRGVATRIVADLGQRGEPGDDRALRLIREMLFDLWNRLPDKDKGAEDAGRRWDYEFSVWPREDSVPEIFLLFRSMSGRVVMTVTEQEFGGFRERLGAWGLTLREITRTPYAEPEPVP